MFSTVAGLVKPHTQSRPTLGPPFLPGPPPFQEPRVKDGADSTNHESGWGDRWTLSHPAHPEVSLGKLRASSCWGSHPQDFQLLPREPWVGTGALSGDVTTAAGVTSGSQCPHAEFRSCFWGGSGHLTFLGVPINKPTLQRPGWLLPGEASFLHPFPSCLLSHHLTTCHRSPSQQHVAFLGTEFNF